MTPLGILLLVLLTLLVAAPVAAHDETPEILREVGFDQRLDAPVPLDLVLRDETGRAVTLAAVTAGRPALLTLNEYECKNLCPLELEGLAASLHEVGWPLGERFVVVAMSIDPRETPTVALARKRSVVHAYFPPDQHDGWRFLTADEGTIRRLTDAVGFRYAYDAGSQQYAHPTGVVVLTPEGHVARYLFGMDFRPRDVKLALVDASRGRIGSLIDQALLACYRYDAAAGRYTPMVMRLVRVAGIATLLGMGLMLLILGRARA